MTIDSKGMKMFTMKIPAGLHREARIASARACITMQAFVTHAIENYLAAENSDGDVGLVIDDYKETGNNNG